MRKVLGNRGNERGVEGFMLDIGKQREPVGWKKGPPEMPRLENWERTRKLKNLEAPWLTSVEKRANRVKKHRIYSSKWRIHHCSWKMAVNDENPQMNSIRQSRNLKHVSG
uniref:Uncharacterized protein n=1 Tax=Panagrolaimus sp. JU765 TaxID=591449 RepID=A0AC34RK53_9BILA